MVELSVLGEVDTAVTNMLMDVEFLLYLQKEENLIGSVWEVIHTRMQECLIDIIGDINV